MIDFDTEACGYGKGRRVKMSRSFKVLGIGFVIVTFLLVLAGWSRWGWLMTKSDDGESGLAIVRNLGLVLAGVYGLLFAFWRSWVADCQARTAQRRLMNERYQKSAEMLGSDVLTVRLGGIYALRGLAEEDPEQYHVPIMRLSCAFVRNSVKDESDVVAAGGGVEGENQPKPFRPDVRAIMDAIAATRSDADIALEKKENFRPELRGADLRGGIFIGDNWSSVNLFAANLSGRIPPSGGANLSGPFGPPDVTSFNDVNLSDAGLNCANLSGAILIRTNLSGADLSFTNLSGAILSQPIGLTQAQLNQARADPNKPPYLEDCFDAKTNKPLVWHGKPLEDNE